MSVLLEPDMLFHKGEISVQEAAGGRDTVMRYANRMIRPFMPDQHRAFFELLPFIIVSLLDDDGYPWPTVLVGNPGFIQSPDVHTLLIKAAPLLEDMLKLNTQAAAKVGLLGIELPTRRRNRMNGFIKETATGHMAVHVEQSFGNCPKYIQRRTVNLGASNAKRPEMLSHSGIVEGEAHALIGRADTFFIASRSGAIKDGPCTGLDVSHRGGQPGFVRVDEGHSLMFPDFSGNGLFNTLGNIADDGRVGLLFPDFETGNAVFVSGVADIIWDEDQIQQFAGAQRFVRVRVKVAVLAEAVLPVTGSLVEAWPRLVDTGRWAEVGGPVN